VNCEKCGRPNPEGSRFCGGCGAPSGPATRLVQDAPTLSTPQSAATFSSPPTFSVGQTNTRVNTPEFNWSRVSRFQIGTAVGSFLTIVGLFLPWASGYGYSFSGLSIHGFLWFSFLILVAVLVLTVLEVFIPGFSDNWPQQPVVSGIAMFSALLVLIGVLDFPGGYGWSIGPFWCLVMSIALVAVTLTPYVPALYFLLPISTSVATGTTPGVGRVSPVKSQEPARQFCPSCGNAIDSNSQFCAYCGARTS